MWKLAIANLIFWCISVVILGISLVFRPKYRYWNKILYTLTVIMGIGILIGFIMK